MRPNSQRSPTLSVQNLPQDIYGNEKDGLSWLPPFPTNDPRMSGDAADRNSLAAIHRIKGVKEETVCECLQRAARHVEEIEAVLLANYPVSHAQLDALWA